MQSKPHRVPRAADIFEDGSDSDEEMIDEIIETDPDESQHHPIVDGMDVDENGQEFYNENHILALKDEDDMSDAKMRSADKVCYRNDERMLDPQADIRYGNHPRMGSGGNFGDGAQQTFDPYDSRFFQKIKNESNQIENDTQFQKKRHTSATRRPGL